MRAKVPASGAQRHRDDIADYITGQRHYIHMHVYVMSLVTTLFSFFFSNTARGTLHKRGKEGVELRPKTLYTHIQLHIFIMSMVATQLLLFLSLVECAAGQIRFINLGRIWPAGRTLDMPGLNQLFLKT